MREYGQVQSAFWQSTDAQAFSDHGKLLALYLLTGPHANGIGCYWLPNGYITADLDWASKDVEAAFVELSGNGLGNGSTNGFAYRFEGVVFIPKFLKWNKIANPNVASARFAEFDALSNTEAKRRAARAMLEFCSHWSEPQRKTLETVAQTVPQTVTQTEPNPTQPNPIQEANTGTAAAGAGQGAIKAENCPQAQIIALYHELLPELPPAREWPDANAAQLRARWRSTPERQSLDWWRKFFGYVHESDFLMGRKTDFQASLGWLVKASNFAKVVNGNYENRGNA